MDCKLSASIRQNVFGCNGKHVIAALFAAALALPATGLAQSAPPAKPPGKPSSKPQNFDGLTCQSDIAAELTGRKMTNGKVADIEAKYKALKLSYRGGQGMPEDPFILGFWVICGRDYVVLESNKLKVVKAVLASPVPSAEAELSVGQCQGAGGKKLDSTVFLRQASQKQGPWKTDTAWTVREPQLEFVAVKQSGLTCQE